MGASLNDLLITRFFNGFGSGSAISVLKDLAAYVGHTLYFAVPRSSCLRDEFCDENQGKILCTWIGEREHLSNLLLPVVKSLGPSRVLILGSTRSMEKRVPDGATFLARKDIPRYSFRKWYFEYLRVAPKWQSELIRFLGKHYISKRVLPCFHVQLLIAAHALAANLALLRRLGPSAVLTEYDRNSFTAPLILAARSLGIPTLTMVHGVINAPYGYTPLVADRIIVWGRKGRETLIGYGVAQDRIEVAGYPAIGGSTAQGREKALKKVGLPPGKPVVLLATNPIKAVSRRLLAESFCVALQTNPDISPVVRLHPSEHLEFYEPLMKRFPEVLFLENGAWSLEESLAAADVVVCHNTSYGFEALVKRKPVVLFDVIPEPLMGSVALVHEAGCPRARNGEELSASVARVLKDPEYRESLLGKAKAHTGEVYDAFGFEAAKRTAQCVLHAAGKGLEALEA